MERKAFGKHLVMFWLTALLLCFAGVCTAAADDTFTVVNTVAADDTVTVNVTGTYGQTEARSMLDMINEFRTGSDAWYWNSDDTTKTTCSNLGKLTYDYALEQVAMKRAMETAIYWSHTRPNETTCFTLSVDSIHSWGENLAYGTNLDAESAFALWKEENEDYAGQGHRRNMLGSGYKAVGIGHVYYNGCHFWVQEFGYSVSSVSETTANDAETTEAIEIAASAITAKQVTFSPESLSVTLGKEAALPTVSVGIKTTYSRPSSSYCPVTLDSISWTSADSSIASISGENVTGAAVGTTSLSATILGDEKTVSVTVQKISLADAAVTISDACTYTGSALEPTPTVTLDGSILSTSCYTVAYTNNINAGTATVTVTGTGNYEGTASGTFTIAQRTISGAALSAIADQTYTGSKIKPSVTVADNGKKLTESTDYTVSYENNTNVGTARVTVTGTGNYTGSLSGSFTISEADIADCTVSDLAGEYYTGNAITPDVTVTFGSYTLVKGTDYTLSYANNTEVGTATVTIQGTGNFKGSAVKTFAIQAKPIETTLTDAATGAVYRVTQESADADPVAVYQKPQNAKTASVVIPDTIKVNGRTCKVTSIAANAFKNNRALKKVKIGKYVQTIGKNAFSGCTKLASVTGGASLTKIGDSAFQKCTALKKITIPARVKSIGKKAFYGCKNLRTITIKTKLLTAKTIGTKAFTGTYKKAAVKVPSSKLKLYKKILPTKGLSKSAKVKK